MFPKAEQEVLTDNSSTDAAGCLFSPSTSLLRALLPAEGQAT